MSANFWLGVVIVVCVLELIRIALSTYVLVHILESRALAAGHGEIRTARQSLAALEQQHKREALVQPTLLALRAAMDELHQGAPGPRVQAAVAALDTYVSVSSGGVVR